LGMLSNFAAPEKLPASTTFTNTGIASSCIRLSRILHSDSGFYHLVHNVVGPYIAFIDVHS
jgi:hypothetical protein